MSDTFRFYDNKSPSHYLNKVLTQLPDEHRERVINFKGNYNIEDPEIMLDYDPVIQSHGNYAFNPASGMYYFFQAPPVLLPGGRMLIKLHIDILMSFKQEILKLSPIITRAENLRNSYLPDGDMPIQANIEADSVKFKSSPLLTSQQFCLIVAGGV